MRRGHCWTLHFFAGFPQCLHCTLHNVQCTLYIVHCTLYIAQCTLYTALFRETYIVNCTLKSVYYTFQKSCPLHQDLPWCASDITELSIQHVTNVLNHVLFHGTMYNILNHVQYCNICLLAQTTMKSVHCFEEITNCACNLIGRLGLQIDSAVPWEASSTNTVLASLRFTLLVQTHCHHVHCSGHYVHCDCYMHIAQVQEHTRCYSLDKRHNTLFTAISLLALSKAQQQIEDAIAKRNLEKSQLEVSTPGRNYIHGQI